MNSVTETHTHTHLAIHSHLHEWQNWHNTVTDKDTDIVQSHATWKANATQHRQETGTVQRIHTVMHRERLEWCNTDTAQTQHVSVSAWRNHCTFVNPKPNVAWSIHWHLNLQRSDVIMKCAMAWIKRALTIEQLKSLRLQPQVNKLSWFPILQTTTIFTTR